MYASTNHKRKWLLLGLIAVLVLALFAAGYWTFYRYCTRPPELSLYPADHNLYPGDRFTLRYTAPEHQTLQWDSSDHSVVQVDGDGGFTALSVGTVSVTLSCGDFSAATTITVQPDTCQNMDSLFDRNDFILTVGNSQKLLWDGDSTPVWSCSAPEIAKVDEEGNVTALSPGTAVVRATDGNASQLFGVTVTSRIVSGCFFTYDALPNPLPPGFSVLMPIRIWEGQDVQWFSSDESVATVKDGVVTALYKGECVIRVTDGTTTYAMPLTVGYTAAAMIAGGEYRGEHMFLYDYTEDTLLFSFGDMTERLYPASTTKILTSFVALQYIPEDAVIIPGEEIEYCPENSSMAGIEKGVPLTREELITAVLLCSGNDAARTMAVTAGRNIMDDPYLPWEEAIAVFMSRCNQQARALGAADTHFVTPDGYHDPEHYTTASDLLLFTKAAMEVDLITKIGGTHTYPFTLSDGTEQVWHTFVGMLCPEDPYYCPFITGLKTGFTTPAGNCLIATAEYCGKTYICATMGCETLEERYVDILMMLEEYVFSK